MRILTRQPLKRFTTFFGCSSGSARSRAIVQEEIAANCGKGIEYLKV
jgi:hypothetical protein